MKLRNFAILSVGAIALCAGLSAADGATSAAGEHLVSSPLHVYAHTSRLNALAHASPLLTRVAFDGFEQPCLQNSPCLPEDPTAPGYSPEDPTAPDLTPADPDLTPSDPVDPTDPYITPTDPDAPDYDTCDDCENDGLTNTDSPLDLIPN